MKTVIKLIFVCCPLLLGSCQKENEQQEERVTTEDVKREARETMETTKEFASQQQAYEDKKDALRKSLFLLKDSLEKANLEIDNVMSELDKPHEPQKIKE